MAIIVVFSALITVYFACPPSLRSLKSKGSVYFPYTVHFVHTLHFSNMIYTLFIQFFSKKKMGMKLVISFLLFVRKLFSSFLKKTFCSINQYGWKNIYNGIPSFKATDIGSKNAWIFDSDATNHTTFDLNLFLKIYLLLTLYIYCCRWFSLELLIVETLILNLLNWKMCFTFLVYWKILSLFMSL